MNNEPVMTIGGAALGLVAAAILLLQSFGVPIDEARGQALYGFASAAIVLGGLFYARRQVVPVDKANKAIKQAVKLPVATDPEDYLFEKGS